MLVDKKLAAVLEAEGIADAELGAWLRRRGLKDEHLRQWRETLDERAGAVFAPREPQATAETRKRVKELERELKRKDAAALFEEVQQREDLARGQVALHADNGGADEGRDA